MLLRESVSTYQSFGLPRLRVALRSCERLQELTDPGLGALCMGLKLAELVLQGVLDLDMFLQPSLQVSVALDGVVAVFQEIFRPDSLSAYRCHEFTEGFSFFTNVERENQDEEAERKDFCL